MTHSDKISIVLVHGAWADGSNWDEVIPTLLNEGHRVSAVQNPLISLAADVEATHRAIDRMPGKVLLVGHSWGGAVITEAGRHDQVAGLVYISGFAPEQGESLNDILSAGAPSPPPEAFAGIDVDAHGFLWLTAEKMAGDFAQDLPSAKQRTMTVSQGPIAMSCFGDKVGVPAWRSKPSWYLVAENDRMIPPTAARAMAQRAGATISSVASSHVLMISRPSETTALILAAAHALTS